MASGPSYVLLCTLMLMIVREGVASSQFLNDFGLCIVDKGFTSSAGDLMYTTDPVVERGSAASFNKPQDRIEINDDGTYLFIIHRAGMIARNSGANAPPPFILEISNRPNGNGPIAQIVDTGVGSISTVHVLAELKRGNRVSISIDASLTVAADVNRPFIFSAFLLYHTPIVSFPRARQSAFSVNLDDVDLSVADSIIDTFAESPTVNIGDEFDRTTGVYTAPFEGLYVFHLAVTFSPKAAGEGKAAVAFQTNGNTKAQVSDKVQSAQPQGFRKGYGTYYVPPQNSAITVAQNLNQGDKITLRNIIAVAGVSGSVTFVGYLLS